ncbi:potassium channel subfamily K member 5-like [Pollicipes pollicipes]|uniref:potassium channel subfamily K member 5-like n=1 Tax=Pollicipes pollicipes TaxID=41117 RepID=UPI0018858070|nr:potassium channel subfamily K member 5-like [Pollicipes pollicipes]
MANEQLGEYRRIQDNSTEESGPSWSTLKTSALSSCEEEGAHRVEVLLESYGLTGELDTLDEAVQLCGDGAYQLAQEQRDVPWSFIDSVFFCMTVVTTIGYGHISPSSPGGQIFCIVYSLLGIPTSGLLLAGLSDFFFAGNLLNFYDFQMAAAIRRLERRRA